MLVTLVEQFVYDIPTTFRAALNEIPKVTGTERYVPGWTTGMALNVALQNFLNNARLVELLADGALGDHREGLVQRWQSTGTSRGRHRRHRHQATVVRDRRWNLAGNVPRVDALPFARRTRAGQHSRPGFVLERHRFALALVPRPKQLHQHLGRFGDVLVAVRGRFERDRVLVVHVRLREGAPVLPDLLVELVQFIESDLDVVWRGETRYQMSLDLV